MDFISSQVIALLPSEIASQSREVIADPNTNLIYFFQT